MSVNVDPQRYSYGRRCVQYCVEHGLDALIEEETLLELFIDQACYDAAVSEIEKRCAAIRARNSERNDGFSKAQPPWRGGSGGGGSRKKHKLF